MRQREWGALLIFVLVSLMPLPCLIDWTPMFSEHKEAREDQESQETRGSGRAAVTEMPPLSGEQQQFLLKEYETVAGEIKTRIEHEHLLFVLKFTVIGAVLGLIFKAYRVVDKNEETEAFTSLQQSSEVAVCCWAAVAVAAIIDVRIFFNANLIFEAGGWIRTLEDFLLPQSRFSGWEGHFAESKLITSRLRPLIFVDRQLLTWILYVVTLGIFVPRRNDSVRSRRVLDIALVAIPLCFVLFWFVGVNFYFRTGGFFRYCVLCAVCMGLTLGWIMVRRKPVDAAASDS